MPGILALSLGVALTSTVSLVIFFGPLRHRKHTRKVLGDSLYTIVHCRQNFEHFQVLDAMLDEERVILPQSGSVKFRGWPQALCREGGSNSS